MELNSLLFEAAAKVRQNAYAPYSGYRVGCAILGEDGQTYVGANYENISFGATICAERVAIGAMIAAGCQQIKEIYVVTKDGVAPCGVCRQALSEFCSPNTPVHCATESGSSETLSFGELLPRSFDSTEVKPRPDASKS